MNSYVSKSMVADVDKGHRMSSTKPSSGKHRALSTVHRHLIAVEISTLCLFGRKNIATYLAFMIGLSHDHSPRALPVPAVENPPWIFQWRKEQSAVEQPVQDIMLQYESIL